MQFLTRLPAPRMDVKGDNFPHAMRWFPAVGLVIGLILSGAAFTGSLIDPWTGALAALVAWVLVTGALHLDGLSDLADASGAAHKDRERFLAVMADPHVGSFGVVAIGLQLIAKIILLHGLIEAQAWAVLALIPFAARIGPLAWTRWLEPLHSGLAARFAKAIRLQDIIGWAAVLSASALIAPFILIAPILIALWGLWLHRALGGVSGDCHGAGIELVETGLLAALLIGTRLL
nr:adenosylcobinamide-GDP ribazoletransferase [Sphingobium boeckii]